ncbi:MAG: sensor histidine kinase [Merismopedia sp. SIO2A8]|nr:sensor histidine kinase [Symploca sp. SIO2B6]NET48486.1 sensor histidine kinase [Merismopedia sp. SIO2A8]
MFQATRRRLAIWYTTVTAVLLLIFATGFYWYVRNTLVERVDDTLKHVVEVMERSLVIEPDQPFAHREGDTAKLKETTPHFHVNVDASFRNNAGSVDDDHIDLEWFNASRELMWSTLEHPLNTPLHVNPHGETVHQGDTQLLRQVTQPIRRGRQILGYLRVSHPWFEVTKPTQMLMVDLIFGSMTTIGTVAAIGWLLSGVAMTPVRDSYQRLKQFTADASHELRSPIAVLQTNIQVALADPNPDLASQQTQLKIVERITRRLGRLVDDLLFLARQDGGMPSAFTQSVSLTGILEDVADEQMIVAHLQGITLSVDPFLSASPSPSSPLYPVLGDRDQLFRLFTNIVSNAIQYTPNGGEVHVCLSPKGTTAKRSLPTQIDVTVTDTGIGIPADDLAHIFERFYQVDPARSPTSLTTTASTSIATSSGSGLGLAIAYVIVQNHHGSITINSQLDQGTTVTVTLPLTSDSPLP